MVKFEMFSYALSLREIPCNHRNKKIQIICKLNLKAISYQAFNCLVRDQKIPIKDLM